MNEDKNVKNMLQKELNSTMPSKKIKIGNDNLLELFN